MQTEQLPEEKAPKSEKSAQKGITAENQKIRAKEVARRLKSIEHFCFIWGEQARYFLPPRKLISWHYVSQILGHEKKLLKSEQVGTPLFLPKAKGQKISIWLRLKAEPQFACFFPDISSKRQVPRDYFLNVS